MVGLPDCWASRAYPLDESESNDEFKGQEFGQRLVVSQVFLEGDIEHPDREDGEENGYVDDD